ncbi:Bcl-2 apoptosis regulator protein [European chub iridovirus]|nr:Bcl-2 apoptosis regulator protein [European chub iridovirus]
MAVSLFKHNGYEWWFMRPMVHVSVAMKNTPYDNVTYSRYEELKNEVFKTGEKNWYKYIVFLVCCVESCKTLKEDPYICAAKFLELTEKDEWYAMNGGWLELKKCSQDINLHVFETLSLYGGLGCACYLLYKTLF